MGVRHPGRCRRRDRARLRHRGPDRVARRLVARAGEARRHRARSRRERHARLGRRPGFEAPRRQARDRRGAPHRPDPGRGGRGVRPRQRGRDAVGDADHRRALGRAARAGARRGAGRRPDRQPGPVRRGRRRRCSPAGCAARSRRSSATRSSISRPRSRAPATASSASTPATARSASRPRSSALDDIAEAWAKQASGSPGAEDPRRALGGRRQPAGAERAGRRAPDGERARARRAVSAQRPPNTNASSVPPTVQSQPISGLASGSGAVQA